MKNEKCKVWHERAWGLEQGARSMEENVSREPPRTPRVAKKGKVAEGGIGILLRDVSRPSRLIQILESLGFADWDLFRILSFGFRIYVEGVTSC
ncbi:MAG: hypothetical protein EHM79_00025 [Geobacter sp.]|nr:MAG: hypothetical protein EHM79_00025 [Geobacter sp.]